MAWLCHKCGSCHGVMEECPKPPTYRDLEIKIVHLETDNFLLRKKIVELETELNPPDIRF